MHWHFPNTSKALISVAYNQTKCMNLSNYRIPIFKRYRFTSLICKAALNTVSVLSVHLYHFFGGLLNTDLPIMKLSFKWLTAPYWHEINIRKGKGWTTLDDLKMRIGNHVKQKHQKTRAGRQKTHTTAFPAIRASPSSANREREPNLPSWCH